MSGWRVYGYFLKIKPYNTTPKGLKSASAQWMDFISLLMSVFISCVVIMNADEQ